MVALADQARQERRTATALGTVGRCLWWSLATVLGVVGVAGSYVLLGTADAVLLAGLVGFLATFSGWIVRTEMPDLLPVPPLPLLAALSGATGLAVVGLSLALGPVGPAVCVAIALTGRRLVRRSERCRPDGRGVVRAPRPPAQPPPPTAAAAATGGHSPADRPSSTASLSTLGTPELCRTWQLTYPRLGVATSAADTEHLVELRRDCLAELERRDPVAFGRWLPTARAASDPARYFCRPSPRASRDVAP